MTPSRSVVIIDYGMGNLRSIEKAIAAVGGNAMISSDPGVVRGAERLILPGVGAFGDAMDNLRRNGLEEAVKEAAGKGTPLLGLCLGLQLLFCDSEEFGSHRGLGIVPGKVRRFDKPGLHVPHVGWNQVESRWPDPLLSGIPEGSYFYFVHSYFVEPRDDADAIAWTDYGGRFCSVARRGSAWGVQFHPEKSQEMGKRLLYNFLRT
ncbi:MAG: imidazole glycerol phosphate synthase subunit HisH [Acidobacteria bacterium]|nr:imidazole glycerol phosphate synthase subunit HisH [Acidobacteriota bacterium]